MNAVLNDKYLFNDINSYIYYTEKQIKNFKSHHYFFNQYKLNKEIRWLGFILRDDIKLFDCYDTDKKIYLDIFI